MLAVQMGHFAVCLIGVVRHSSPDKANRPPNAMKLKTSAGVYLYTPLHVGHQGRFLNLSPQDLGVYSSFAVVAPLADKRVSVGRK